MKSQTLTQGAEAVISLKDNQIIKQRIKKSYRIPQLDEELRKTRTKKEAKLLQQLEQIIPVPKLIEANLQDKQIIMEFIDGKKLSEHLEQLNYKQVCKQIGVQTAKLHDNNIIHGDLTTSNMIYAPIAQENNHQIDSQSNNPKNISLINKKNNNPLNKSKSDLIINKIKDNNKVFFIDFGLSFHSTRIEDKAVDLHLIKQALEAKHFTIWETCFKEILKNYNPCNKTLILNQLKKVEARGRYKH